MSESKSVHPASLEARDEIVLGVVGGSGLYSLDALKDVREVELSTPFGDPSASFLVGKLPRDDGSTIKAVFLPRHGEGHRYLPGEINYRANIHGFKQLGVTHLLSVSAVGSLKKEIEPGHMVLPDQLIDRTKSRASTFFGEGVVGHVQFGEPSDPSFRQRVAEVVEGHPALRKGDKKLHNGGTCIVMEGPAFSTRAESELYRSWGASVIGMTALPEAKLAREAEISYALLAMATDYDCWYEEEEEVSVDAVMAIMHKNVNFAREIIAAVAASLPQKTSEMPYPQSTEFAVMTAAEAIPEATRHRLDLIVGHRIS